MSSTRSPRARGLRRTGPRRPAEDRAACLDRAADLLEAERGAVMALCIREAGKTLMDALAELREAVDFCRYYAGAAAQDFAKPHAHARADRRAQPAARCTAAASSPASAPGTSRWRSSWAR